MASYNRDKYLKRKYGISLKQYNKMLKKQKGRCAICGKKQSECKRNLAVDHSHKPPYEVRGLLCTYCNTHLLKCLRDNKEIAKGLIKYLQNWIKKS